MRFAHTLVRVGSVPLRISPRHGTADVKKTSEEAGCVDPEMWLTREKKNNK